MAEYIHNHTAKKENAELTKLEKEVAQVKEQERKANETVLKIEQEHNQTEHNQSATQSSSDTEAKMKEFIEKEKKVKEELDMQDHIH